MYDLKTKYELNENNDKILSILSGGILIIILNYADPICVSLPIVIFAQLTISSGFKLTWITQSIITTVSLDYTDIILSNVYCFQFNLFNT